MTSEVEIAIVAEGVVCTVVDAGLIRYEVTVDEVAV